MHIYAFGSVCRGDIDTKSDVDLLAIVEGKDDRFDAQVYSIYSYDRIIELWEEGNPFAWHLSLESALVHADNNIDFLRSLESPNAYKQGLKDCEKFMTIFYNAKDSLVASNKSIIFDLSSIFLAIRNFATCYSLAYMDKPDFSRRSAINLGTKSLNISPQAFDLLIRSRILCTRGIGDILNSTEIKTLVNEFDTLEKWMTNLISEVK